MNNHKIGLIIPSTMNINEAASSETVANWVKDAKLHFATLFGGFTSHNAMGGWVSEKGIVEEPVTVVASFTDEVGLSHLGEVRAFARKMAQALNQEAVAIEVDSSMEFVPPLSMAA